MIAKAPRRLKTGHEFAGLITRNKPMYRQVLADANTKDTLKLIQQVVKGSLSQTSRLAPQLRGSSLRQTCQNIWKFIYEHIQYAKDKEGAEEIRDPGRTWADRKSPGVDCDDYAVFISSLLHNLGIPHKLRVTAYGGDWQHIYVVVPKDGNATADLDQADRNTYITIDDVTDYFDYEVKYTKKQDIPMTLNHLSGLPDMGMNNGGTTDLGKTWFGKAFQAVGKAGAFVAKPVAKAAVAVVKTVRTVATTPIRLGILAWMKTDLKKGAQRLRWGYVPYSECAKYTDYGPKAYGEIVDALKRLNNTFVNNLGGQANVLRMAIVTGKGNANREVSSSVANLSGLSGIGDLTPINKNDPDYAFVLNLSSATPNQPISHPDLRPGINGLGVVEPISTTIIAAASAILLPLLALLKGKEKDPNDPVPDEYRPAPAPEPDPVDDQAQLDTISANDAPDDGSMSADDAATDATPDPAPDDNSLGAVAIRKKKAAVRVKSAVATHAATGKVVTPVHRAVAVKAKAIAPAHSPSAPRTASVIHTLAPRTSGIKTLPVTLSTPMVKPLPAGSMHPVAKKKTKTGAGKTITAVRGAITSAGAAVAHAASSLIHPAKKAAVKTAVQHNAKAAKAAADAGDHATAAVLKKQNADLVRQTVQSPSVPVDIDQTADDAMDIASDDTTAQVTPQATAADPVQRRLNTVASTVQRTGQYIDQGTAIVNQARTVIRGQAPSGPTTTPTDDGYTPYQDVTDNTDSTDTPDNTLVASAAGSGSPMTAGMGTIAAVGVGALLLGVLFRGHPAAPAHRKALAGVPPKKKATPATYSRGRSARPFSGIDI